MTSKRVYLDTNVLDFISGCAEIEATLTTEHPASSYGLPVVLVNGELVNPAECAPILAAEASAEWLAMDDEHVSGADSVSLGIAWDRAAADAKRAATPRHDAETLSLLDAARRAGYVVNIR